VSPFHIIADKFSYNKFSKIALRLNSTIHLFNADFKGATSQFAYLEKFGLRFSSLFVIRVNRLHPSPSLFLYGLLLSLWCFSILVNYYFHVFLLKSESNFMWPK